MNQVGLVLQASQIPDGLTVQKRTGSTDYVLRKEIRVGSQVIKAEEGTVFLCDPDTGDIRSLPATTKLSVYLEMTEARQFLDSLLRGEEYWPGTREDEDEEEGA